VYVNASSEEPPLIVHLLQGRVTDAEREEVLAAWERFHRVGRGRLAFGVVLVDEGGSPNAKWRRRLSALQASYPGPLHIGIVTRQAMARGVLTAIEWLKPRESLYHAYGFDTFDAAVAKFEAIGGRPLHTLRTLFAEVQEKACSVGLEPRSPPMQPGA
jgi:hypothetical protein